MKTSNDIAKEANNKLVSDIIPKVTEPIYCNSITDPENKIFDQKLSFLYYAKRGNFVSYPDYNGDGIDKIWRIKQIHFDTKTIRLTDGRFELSTDFSSVKPIELSVEWLKKAGYKQLKRIEKTYSLGSFEDNSAIYFTGVRFIHINTGTHLEWVHEWQNLYAAIHKKELKFI